jgi:hypothetical protein
MRIAEHMLFCALPFEMTRLGTAITAKANRASGFFREAL